MRDADRLTLFRTRFRLGFRLVILCISAGAILFVGMSLVYLSFQRVKALTLTAASSFLETTSKVSTDRIGAQLEAVRDALLILQDLPSAQSEAIHDPRLHAVMASMLRNNDQIDNIYIGYDDGGHVEMNAVRRDGGVRMIYQDAPEDAWFRLKVINGDGKKLLMSRFLSKDLAPLSENITPTDYDPRRRPWYVDAREPNASLITDPYIFAETGKPGYTLRVPMRDGRPGVIAADIPMNKTEEMLRRQQVGASGTTFMFNDKGLVVAHPDLSKVLTIRDGKLSALPNTEALDRIGITNAISAWKRTNVAQQFFEDPGGRDYAAAFRSIPIAGPNIHLAVVAPLDEFYSDVEVERRRLFLTALGFVLAAPVLVILIGNRISRNLNTIARQTNQIRRFQLTDTPRVRSVIREIDDLGRSVATMRSVVHSFGQFVPKHLVRLLVETGSVPRLGGERRDAVVMFTDVADFTSLTEDKNPSDVMIRTSQYFGGLSAAIVKEGGTIDKFIGDAVMAFWSSSGENDDFAINACAAALACLRASDAINAEFAREDWPPYRTRIGLHLGEVVAGNVGSPDRMNYTVLGAPVNLAARLEALNKIYGTSILVSEVLKARTDHRFAYRSVDVIVPKGFSKGLSVHELRGELASMTVDEEAFLNAWEETYARRSDETSRFVEALRSFLTRYPEDRLAAHLLREMLTRSQDLAAE